MEIIKIKDLFFTYPDKKEPALQNISLTVNNGEFITVFGKSGSGKSTLLRHIKPALSPHGNMSGEILFDKKDIFSLTQKEQSQKIGFVMQNPESQIVTDKVWHEMAFGLESLGFDNKEIRVRVAEMASFFGIQSWFYQKTDELSGGQKQLLNLASVMVMQPSVLILDEPTSQLDPIAVQDFLETLCKINRELGTTIILTEHRLEEALPLSDRVIVMDEGKILADTTPEDIGRVLYDIKSDMCAALPTPMKVYHAVNSPLPCPLTVRDGRGWLADISKEKELKPILPRTEKTYEETALNISDVWFRYEKNSADVIKGLSLKVYKGEFYSLVGGNGTGKTTALSLAASLLTPQRGKINACGRVSMLPQNPQVLFVHNTVLLDLSEATPSKEQLSAVISLCKLNNLLESHPYDLSGGEQQRLALAKVLLTNPDILLLDEPTKGLDAHFKEVLAEIIKKLKENGKTIIAVSHDIEFCAMYADRCGMFFDGNIVSEDTPEKFFAGKNFYTTAANRMARDIIPSAVLADHIIYALDGKAYEQKSTEYPLLFKPSLPCSEQDKKTPKKISLWQIILGCIFVLLYHATYITYSYNPLICSENTFNLISLTQLILAAVCFFPQRKNEAVLKENEKIKFSPKALISFFVVLMAIPITLFAGMYIFGDRKYYLISLLILLEIFVPFIFVFEQKRVSAREIVIISILCAVAVAGKIAFASFPQCKPVLAIVIITAAFFGAEAGFLTGAVTAFVSNFYFSQGPWTPWQMFATGMVGFVAGIIFRHKLINITRVSLSVYGGLAALLIHGIIVNVYSVISYQPVITPGMIISSCVAGLPFDIIHALSTVFFIWLLFPVLTSALQRIKNKYGLIKRD